MDTEEANITPISSSRTLVHKRKKFSSGPHTEENKATGTLSVSRCHAVIERITLFHFRKERSSF